MKRFALIGVGGYIAPRHLRAIKETHNVLVAAMDPSDSVGILDSYFPEADFFTEFERFDRHLEKLRRKGEGVDYVSICSPNYLHDAHVRFGLRIGSDVICEKPLVLNPWNVDGLEEIARETGGRVNTILQLRLHPAIIALKDRVARSDPGKVFDVDLTYITSRGRWYMYSWKGDVKKSGGIANNIGIHFFEMLHHVFGPVRSNVVNLYEEKRASGCLELERAMVRWYLSIDASDLPNLPAHTSGTTYRSITVDGEALEFSEGFDNLHVESYRHILAGQGFGMEVVRPSIEIVAHIRNAVPAPDANGHPLAAACKRPAGHIK